ncbi:MAG TPA: PQQ-binding-like beta-propeller repeat protein, partial [Verrucomicrobiae bacterium]|nr:PQQ-binding-like beta-propeller repeat protein [Verrucomicrobiae bacterium]
MKSSILLACVLSLAYSGRADDWPQWMGPRRDDVWREQGITSRFSTNGPPILWRAPIQGGYSGPAVVGHRLFVLDRPMGNKAPTPGEGSSPSPGVKQERVQCLDSTSGKQLWEHSYSCSYNIGYPAGPRTTPTVADGKVYCLGAMGDLLCLSAEKGEVIWSRH